MEDLICLCLRKHLPASLPVLVASCLERGCLEEEEAGSFGRGFFCIRGATC